MGFDEEKKFDTNSDLVPTTSLAKIEAGPDNHETQDAVFGNVGEGGPNYRNVSTIIL